ncbi:pumilio-family RNA-binding repeat protein, putative (macronuclear) [Tetrahymena thermophila SB210]|uniref:Pumilio-family RNA-binding repeat protein, putative n=1 Tax=Tetrahymena thermophila (strain SB210) TaxID=312017 RepID=Q23EX3_TETTS|nr:pumilio-family RNA-binding repeat protein, putative [Tetrahymena thermophila SB210]EAR95132.3 pumilio-family RNA-binding repeat protein, putative [Tetrahymena thermophila SB210]|eukprot:XP_001015377.3 pumilio-family RNA-binding repeat protein, putative [Tetrahymena thermophila SB210]
MSRKILIQLYSQRDSPHLFVNRSKSADCDREENLVHYTYINPRIIKYILQEETERQDNSQEHERSIANNQSKHDQFNSDELNRDKSISDNLSSSPMQQKPLKEKKLKFKNLNFNPSVNTNADSNYSLENNQETQVSQNIQSSQQNLQVYQQHFKDSNYSYQSQHSSESVASNLNTTIKSTSLNLDEPSYCDFKKEENDSKRLQEEYQKNKFQTFENEIKNNLIKFSTNRYYKFILQNVLESDLIFRDCEQVEQIYFSRFGQKIIREYLNILEGEDLVQLLKVINTKLLDPFEFSEQKIDFLSNNLLSKKYLCGEQYGCLIVNYIVEQYSQNQFKESTQLIKQEIILQKIHQIIMRIVKKAHQLSQHYYSNYVIQLILEKLPNDCEINQQLNRALLPYFIDLSTNKFGSNVVEKAIRFGDDYFREEIWKIISYQSEDGQFINLEILVNDQFANYVIQRYYEHCNSYTIKQQFEEILHILNNQSRLQQYGQHVRMQIFDKNKPESKVHHLQQKDYNSSNINRSYYSQNTKIGNTSSLNNNFSNTISQKRYNYSRNGSIVSNESGGLESVSSRKSSSNIPTHLIDQSNQSNLVQTIPSQQSAQQFMPPNDQNIIGYGNNNYQKNYSLGVNPPKNQFNNQYFNQNGGIHPFSYSQNVNQKAQHFSNTFQQTQFQQSNACTSYPLENPYQKTQNQNQLFNQSHPNYFNSQKNQFKPKLTMQGGSYKGVGQKIITNNFQQMNEGYQVNYSNYQNIQNINNVQGRDQKLSAENNRKMLNQNYGNTNQLDLKLSIDDQINKSEGQQKYFQENLNQDQESYQ